MSALVDLITVDAQKCALALSDYVIDPQFSQSLSMSEATFQYSNRGQVPEGITFYEWLQLSVSPFTFICRTIQTLKCSILSLRRSSKTGEKCVSYLIFHLGKYLMASKNMMKAMISMNEVLGSLSALHGCIVLVSHCPPIDSEFSISMESVTRCMRCRIRNG